MITVQLNEPDFEYDIHSLVKAFYPPQDVLVKAIGREEFPESVFHLAVCYDRPGGNISFSFYEGETCALHGSVQTDFADRKATKNKLKQELYRLLCEYAGKTLPWGTLTGIRPTKIPMEMLEESRTEDEIRAFMRETYFASEEKIELSLAVAKRERELLSRIDYENGYSLYIGIPFCPSTCLYCSFTSYPLAKWAARMDEYLDALEKEIRFTAQACRHKVLNSVYIGGGTPTSLSAEQMDRLLTMIGTYFGIADENGRFVYDDLDASAASGREAQAADPSENGAESARADDLPGRANPAQNQTAAEYGSESGFADSQSDGSNTQPEAPSHPASHLLEFTVEAGRPDSITREKLEVIHRHGVSRISINPQTMKEETLRLIGRQHTVQQTIDSFRLAREVGFDNINMDLIVGLPEEGIEDVGRTMDALAELDPDNITVHSLAVKRAARLRMQREDYENLHIENTAQTIDLTAERCQAMGLSPYYLYRQKNMAGNFENVGYAKPGKAGIYNILIMEEKQSIIALGAGAMTKFVFDGGRRIERVENVKDVTNYLERTDEMIERKRKEMEEIQWL